MLTPAFWPTTTPHRMKRLTAVGIAIQSDVEVFGPMPTPVRVGPNFTDEYWIHGGGIADVFTVIKYGVLEKGMISWQETLNPLQMQQVASYVLSLKGTTPAAPKEPQGSLWTAPDAAPADTAATVATPTEE